MSVKFVWSPILGANYLSHQYIAQNVYYVSIDAKNIKLLFHKFQQPNECMIHGDNTIKQVSALLAR